MKKEIYAYRVYGIRQNGEKEIISSSPFKIQAKNDIESMKKSSIDFIKYQIVKIKD